MKDQHKIKSLDVNITISCSEKSRFLAHRQVLLFMDKRRFIAQGDKISFPRFRDRNDKGVKGILFTETEKQTTLSFRTSNWKEALREILVSF